MHHNQKQLIRIGLLFESQVDIMSLPNATEATHYHWRELEEVEAVTKSLTALGYQVDKIGILDALLQLNSNSRQLPDFVWNLSVGVTSRNRTALAPAILEQLGIPYTGGDATVKSLTLNKDFLKPLLQWSGILTPDWYCYDSAEDVKSLPPWSSAILKPSCEGYSLGLQRFDIQEGLTKLQQTVAKMRKLFAAPIICEEFIVGREITVGVVGNSFPLLLGGVETVNAQGESLQTEILDLPAKRQGKYQKVGVDLFSPDLERLKQIVWQLMQLLKPLDYATFDFRISTDGQPYLLDINADATLHPQRSLAQIAYAAGLSYQQLIEMILNVSWERWQKK
ncbi:D-alanine--D-alanine ligase [Brunnivagina elsteri]|uniref:D-alanine--D-alanine ligase n=1 Tax=Brunnivagina elsteri TaxID=1247191 RepID=UPI001FEB0ECB|nr:D-alanine--D-alanine ligase [Calothrix elsteri]